MCEYVCGCVYVSLYMYGDQNLWESILSYYQGYPGELEAIL